MPLRKKTGDRDVDDNINALSDEITTIKKIDILGGRLIQGIQLPAATDVDIRHFLKTAPVGWIVVDLTGAAATGRIERMTTNTDQSTFLRLRATGWGATITISLWVF